eukprot:GHVN01031680.1.p1 GENE.GHVN01031680.1~~GHVN01031680.1.p1  ORF type:complete len:398 (+),score=35.01 GHVN01031680.1:48-1241(+)
MARTRETARKRSRSPSNTSSIKTMTRPSNQLEGGVRILLDTPNTEEITYLKLDAQMVCASCFFKFLERFPNVETLHAPHFGIDFDEDSFKTKRTSCGTQCADEVHAKLSPLIAEEPDESRTYTFPQEAKPRNQDLKPFPKITDLSFGTAHFEHVRVIFPNVKHLSVREGQPWQGQNQTALDDHDGEEGLLKIETLQFKDAHMPRLVYCLSHIDRNCLKELRALRVTLSPEFLSKLPSLETLEIADLSFCDPNVWMRNLKKDMKKPDEDRAGEKFLLPSLKSLKLVDAAATTWLDCPNLQEIIATWGSRSSLEQLAAQFPKLRKINVDGMAVCEVDLKRSSDKIERSEASIEFPELQELSSKRLRGSVSCIKAPKLVTVDLDSSAEGLSELMASVGGS